VRYKQALLGFAWAILTPFVLMLVFGFVFGRVAKVATGPAPYPLFAYLGLIPWNFFSGSVSQGGSSIVTNKMLLNKVYCPREVFPIASMFVVGVDALMSVVVLLVLFVVFTYPPHPEAVWIPVLLTVQLAYTAGVTFLVSSVLVYFRDLQQALPLLLQIGLFATPVAYPISLVPDRFLTAYAVLNPLAPVIDGYRRTVLFGQAPVVDLLALASVSAFVTLTIGYLVFKRLETRFADVA
jgi:ABC-2 type transport system permease protein/lipopolysaccharide transport system permease protein